MEYFSLQLPDGHATTGLLHTPKQSLGTGEREARPLVVALHGGTYTATYYDATPEYSISNISSQLNIPVICITRPGYGSSTWPAPTDPNEPYTAQQGRYLHEVILPAIWKEFGGKNSGTTSLVLHAHSVGAAVALVIAALWSEDSSPAYPLSGLTISGLGTIIGPRLVKTTSGGRLDKSQDPVTYPDDVRDDLVLDYPDMPTLTSTSMLQVHGKLNHVLSQREIADINGTYLKTWKDTASKISVPHSTTFPEFDRMWVINEEVVEEFRKAFTKCPRMEARFWRVLRITLS
ncbi:Putative alpha/beta hydrolase-1 [Septoria linicola]|uniref:Alpha/beta hydrolase-1 n=1 Tax=Septoria linicola TaxID=215465 RepID=A0A9Q9EQD1_9PEZI|nr:putative alpha/beta hydrolase-1 [Septoria linicola]USW58667.1 Putative alpha/beta hydrolase-1 [Septoria linicola]